MIKPEKILFEGAERNKETALSMIKTKHLDWGLFIWHLSLEKLLKGIIAQQRKEVPLIHNLSKIAQKTGIDFTKEQYAQLDEITTFNLEARYDEYKYQFYKKATPEFTKKWSKIANELYIWIEKNKK